MQQSKRMSMNECTEAMMMLKQKHEAELAFIGARQHEEWSQLVRLIACNHQETNDNSDDVIMSEGKSKKKANKKDGVIHVFKLKRGGKKVLC